MICIYLLFSNYILQSADALKYSCVNTWSIGFHAGECRAFVVDGQQVGLVRPDVMKEILNYPQVSLSTLFF